MVRSVKTKALKLDEMTASACDEILSFLDAEAVRNPFMRMIGVDYILLGLLAPILFGLLCVSVVCRAIAK